MKQNGNKRKLRATMRLPITLLFASFFYLSASPPSSALFIEAKEASDGTSFLLATGDIETGDAELIENAFNAVPDMAILMLGSPGGNLLEAERLGRKLRSMGINTIVDPKVGCYSACLVAFIGGAERAVPEKAKLGSHQFYWEDDVTSGRVALSLSQFMSAQMLRYFMDMGVSAEALTHIMETKPEEMFLFEEPGLTNLRLVTNGSFSERKPPRKVAMDRCTGKVVDATHPPEECLPINRWKHIIIPDFLKAHPEYERGSELYFALDAEVRKRQAVSNDPFDPTILEDAHRAVGADRKRLQ